MHILKAILQNGTTSRTWLTYTALFFGFFLLLLSIQLFENLHFILNHSGRTDGYDYLVVNKQITNSMMGDNSRSYFSSDELNQLQKAPAIDNMAPIVSNTFPIAASTGGELGFYTQLFFESLPDDYLDIQPDPWSWSPGQKTVPVVLSADFLNLYNFGFALSQVFPHPSEESSNALSFELNIGGASNSETFTAIVAGFTRRYSSVLVPYSFMHYANETYGQHTTAFTSRVVLKTREADHPQLTRFLQDHGYVTRQENLSLSKLKPLLHKLFAAFGLMGIFVLSLALMSLSLFLELTISRRTTQLKLLAMLGYPPQTLQRMFTIRTFRIIGLLSALSLLLAGILQYLASGILRNFAYEIPRTPHLFVCLSALILPSLVYLLMNRRVKRLISPHY